MQRTLRDDQQSAIDELYDAVGEYAQHFAEANTPYALWPRIMLQAPTGYGKTVLAGALIERALKKGRRVLFTVPALSLIDQTVASLVKEGITNIGVIQAYHEMTDWSQPVQVASVQTLMRRKLPQADLVIVDEAHKFFGKFYPKWFLDEAWRKIPIIGLSATPWTKGLGKYYNNLIIAGTTEEMIKAGHLCDFEVWAPSHPDLKGVRTVAGDYHEGDLSEAMQGGALTADIVRTWIDKGQDRPTFCFAVDRAHAAKLQKEFEANGIPSAYMDAYTKREEREDIRRKFHAGEIRIVCNVGVLTTGVDWDVRCLILARPTKSEILFVQIVGRGLRTADGKDHCLILDHSDNHLRLGFVTQIHHDELDDGQKKTADKTDAVPLPKECPKCNFLKPPKCAVCPKCGFKAEKIDKTEVKDGELKKLEKSNKDRMAEIYPKPIAYAELKGYAAERGYNPGWAANKFREMFGVWPNSYRDVPAVTPTEKMRSWIKSRQIAWAKSHRNSNNQPRPAAVTAPPEPHVVQSNSGWAVMDGSGVVLADGFESNSGAWAWIDRRTAA